MRISPHVRMALRIAAIYLVFGAAWIFFSDRILAGLISEPAQLTRVQTFKGWAFVLATAALLFLLARNALRRLAASARRELEIGRRIHDVTALAPVGIYHMDPDGAVTYVNDPAAAIVGRSPEGLLGHGWRTAVHEDDRERVAAAVRDGIARGAGFQLECRLRREDGRIVWVAGQARPQTDEHGNVAVFVGTVTDITERKRAELGLRESERRYSALTNLSPAGIYNADARGLLTYANASLAAMAGLRPEEMLGEDWAHAVHEEDRERVYSMWQRAVDNATEFHDRYRFKHADGTVVWVVEHAIPQRDEDGRLTGFIGTLMDVSSLMLAEENLRDSEARYRELFESNPHPMCVYDRDTLNFLAVNEAMTAHYGYSREELLRMNIKNIRPPEDVSALVNAVKAATGGLYAAGVWRHIVKDGRIIEVDVRSHPVTFGGRAAMLAQMSDVTSQRRAEAALAREQAALRETSARLNHILVTSPTLLYSVRLKDGVFTPLWISDNITRLLGYTNEEAMQPDWWLRNLHPDDLERVRASTSQLLSDENVVNEFRFLRKDRQVVWIRAEMRRLSPGGARVAEFVGAWNDITEQRRVEERLRLDAAAFEGTRDGVMITDLNSSILSANRAFLEVTGYGEAELLGKTPRLFHSGRHQPDFYQAMWAGLLTVGFWRGEIWNRRKNGEIFPVWLTISAVSNSQGVRTHYVAIYTDISKLKETEERLQHLAHFDPLTGLPNRLLFQSRLEHAIDQARRRAGHVSVLFIDLDDFKKVNDSLGHVVGDELLVEVVKRLQTRVRGEDTLARLGGDEFVVLLETLDRPENAATVARALLSALAQPFRLSAGHELHVRGSIGISIFPDDGDSPAEILRSADTAMYRAKDGGGNQFLFFTSEMGAAVLADLEIEGALRQALERGEFELHYQPRINSRNGRIQGVEALLRWNREGEGASGPGQFIPIAERTGLIIPIGNWVLDRACAQFRAWADLGLPETPVAVNVSARQFRSADFESIITGALRRHRVPAEFLTLELTESLLMDRVEESKAILQRLKDIGVRLSLDDFGTGFSSMAYLTRFPIDTLKIDASFVRNVGSDPSAMTIVSSIIELAHRMGMDAVAEGVELEAQYAYLKAQGCDEMQGYLFSRPLPAAQLAELLREGRPIVLPDRAGIAAHAG